MIKVVWLIVVLARSDGPISKVPFYDMTACETAKAALEASFYGRGRGGNLFCFRDGIR